MVKAVYQALEYVKLDLQCQICFSRRELKPVYRLFPLLGLYPRVGMERIFYLI